jgi:hypothetical protein
LMIAPFRLRAHGTAAIAVTDHRRTPCICGSRQAHLTTEILYLW